MINKIKEYKVDKKTQKVHAIILLIIAIPIMILCINSIVETNIELATYGNSVKNLSVDYLDANTLIRNIQYKNNMNQRNMSILLFIFLSGVLFYILHTYFFTDIKLLLDSNGIRLYSIYKKEPSKIFLWKDIKSIQLGNVYTSGSRMPQYKMKIRYLNNIDNVNAAISIRRFQDYNDLIKDIEQMGIKENIDVFHMNE